MADSSQVIRIAYIVHGFQAGGLERCVTRLVDGLDRARFQPFIICLDRSGTAAEWMESTDTPIVELRKGTGGNLRLVRRLAASLRELRIDIAHSHNWGTLLETAVACRLVRPRVLHVHAERGTVLGQNVVSTGRRRLRAAVMRQTLKRADAVLSNSRETARRVASISGLPITRVQIIPNGLDAPIASRERCDAERRRIRSLLRIADDGVLIGSVGRLVPVKDFPTAIGATAAAVTAGLPAHLVLVGDGPERDRLREFAKQAGVVDRVHFVGEQKDVWPWYAAMDVYLNTSLSEGMSQSVVEAMAMGLSLVVTDVGDHRRLAEDAGCGRVAAPGDVAAIGEALLELGRDHRRRKELGARAAEVHAKDHSLAAMMADYERFYEAVAASRVSCRKLVDCHMLRTAPCAGTGDSVP